MKNRRYIFSLFLILIVCSGVFSGCGTEEKIADTGGITATPLPTATQSPTSTPTPTATPLPTATPTPELPFIERSYEKIGQDNVYRVPLEEMENENAFFMSSKSAGDYILLWVTMLQEDDTLSENNTFILLKPGVSTEKYRMTVNMSVYDIELLEDGTVRLNEYDSDLIHIYDNTLKDIRVEEIKENQEDADFSYSEKYEIDYSGSTWIFSDPRDNKCQYIFPKCAIGEGTYLVLDNVFCSGKSIETDNETFNYIQEYRLYNLKDRTVSDIISARDIPECQSLGILGAADDRYVLISAYKNDGNKELLLWDAGVKTSPIRDFCDLSKDDPGEYLKTTVKTAEDEFGIMITPDSTEYDGSEESFKDIRANIEMVNTFILCSESNPEILKTKSGAYVHPENRNNNDGANYTFNRHVFTDFYLKVHGEKRRDAFFNYVDALCEGKDGFECPDEGSAAWSCGRLAHFFFPVGGEYASANYVGNGWAEIIYKIPKEEFLEKERDFEERICAILNDALEEDYSDIEKTLALYEFMTEYCVYDYEMLEHLDEWSDMVSGYRCLIEKKGICGEIASLYLYLLLQCGVDAEETAGVPIDPEEDIHAWNYVTINGQGYLLDATWGLTDEHLPDLGYFLFTDEQREVRDRFILESFDIAGVGLYDARKKYSFDADDDRYRDLWNGWYLAMEEDENCIFYTDWSGKIYRFDYSE